MRHPLTIGLLGLALLSLGGCATAELTAGGQRVVTDPRADLSGCVHLGLLTGQGGGQFGGAYVSNERLMEYAMNDLRNKAAERGATHVIASSGSDTSFGSGPRHTTTVSGNAYRCR